MRYALRIKGCSDPHMWYAGKVGALVPFLREESDCFMSREPAGYTNIVLKADAELVPVECTKGQKGVCTCGQLRKSEKRLLQK